MLTLSAIKADVGSLGGHTRPSKEMMDTARTRLSQAAGEGILLDYDVTHTGDDIFGNVVWDETRRKAQRKGAELRQQGFVGAAMLPYQELEYSAFRDSLEALEDEFKLLEKPLPEAA
jgi:fructose 1,6-bisphosphatase